MHLVARAERQPHSLARMKRENKKKKGPVVPRWTKEGGKHPLAVWRIRVSLCFADRIVLRAWRHFAVIRLRLAAARGCRHMQDEEWFHRDFSSMTKSLKPSFHFLDCSTVGLGRGLLA